MDSCFVVISILNDGAHSHVTIEHLHFGFTVRNGGSEMLECFKVVAFPHIKQSQNILQITVIDVPWQVIFNGLYRLVNTVHLLLDFADLNDS